jgi:hypothetical protein
LGGCLLCWGILWAGTADGALGEGKPLGQPSLPWLPLPPLSPNPPKIPLCPPKPPPAGRHSATTQGPLRQAFPAPRRPSAKSPIRLHGRVPANAQRPSPPSSQQGKRPAPKPASDPAAIRPSAYPLSQPPGVTPDVLKIFPQSLPFSPKPLDKDARRLTFEPCPQIQSRNPRRPLASAAAVLRPLAQGAAVYQGPWPPRGAKGPVAGWALGAPRAERARATRAPGAGVARLPRAAGEPKAPWPPKAAKAAGLGGGMRRARRLACLGRLGRSGYSGCLGHLGCLVSLANLACLAFLPSTGDKGDPCPTKTTS